MAEPTDELLYIASRFSPKIRDALLQSYREFLTRTTEDVIVDALKARGVQGLVELAESLGPDIAANVTPVLYDAWVESGRMTIRIMPDGTFSERIVFESLPVGAVSAAEAYRLALVEGLTESQVETVLLAIEAGIISGVNPITTARSFRSAIGLTANQLEAVDNYRRLLEELDPDALDRALRDHRFDRTVARAIAEGEFLDAEYIDNLVERYRQRTLKFRAETIARTESLRAIQMGEYESLLASAADGTLNPYLRRFWVVTLDERLRRWHLPIPEMNSGGRSITESFTTPLGPLRYPTDPEGDPRNVINCRCRLVYRIVEPGQVLGDIPGMGVFPRDVDL